MRKCGIMLTLILLIFCVTVCHAESTNDPVAAGDVVIFGTYEQDGISDNGPEPIEWMVLDVQDEKALLLARYGLDAKPYHSKWTEITWENCTLRTWLNTEFPDTAFTAEEQAALITTEVDNSNEQGYSEWDTDGGNNTEDRVFLLSYHEAFGSLFADDKARMCLPTDYALAAGTYLSGNLMLNDRETVTWWLRSPGDFQRGAAVVFYDGDISKGAVDLETIAVRPAVWVSVSSGLVKKAPADPVSINGTWKVVSYIVPGSRLDDEIKAGNIVVFLTYDNGSYIMNQTYNGTDIENKGTYRIEGDLIWIDDNTDPSTFTLEGNTLTISDQKHEQLMILEKQE